MAEIKDRVIDIICEKLNVKKEQCTVEATFVDLGADSLDQAELVMEFEEEFDVEISEEENDIGTVGGAIKYIEEASK